MTDYINNIEYVCNTAAFVSTLTVAVKIYCDLRQVFDKKIIDECTSLLCQIENDELDIEEKNKMLKNAFLFVRDELDNMFFVPQKSKIDLMVLGKIFGIDINKKTEVNIPEDSYNVVHKKLKAIIQSIIDNHQYIIDFYERSKSNLDIIYQHILTLLKIFSPIWVALIAVKQIV